jgi:hypothetical protein
MNARVLSLAALLVSAACHHGSDEVVVVEARVPRPVSIEVEVYDPISGFVWQDVGVRIVEAYNERSSCVCETPYPDDWYYTDPSGLVLLSEYAIAAAEVGFATDPFGRAEIAPDGHANEAVVTLEIWAPGFASVFVDVDVTWGVPDVFVSVPFE